MELETYAQNLFRRFPEVLLCLGRNDLEEFFEVQRQAFSITDTDTAKVVHIVLPRKGLDVQGRKLHKELDECEAATPTSQGSNRGRPAGHATGSSHMASSDDMQRGSRLPLQLQHHAMPPALGANLGISRPSSDRGTRPSSDKGSRPSSGKSSQPSPERFQLGSPRDQASFEQQASPISVSGGSSAVETWRKLRKEGIGLKPSSLASDRGFLVKRVATSAATKNKGLPESKADSRDFMHPQPEEVGGSFSSANVAHGAHSSATQATMPSLRNMFGGEPQGPRT